MATGWPYDTQTHIATPNKAAPSDAFNEVQKRIMDLHAAHNVTAYHAPSEPQSGAGPAPGAPSWTFITPEWGWNCKEAGKKLYLEGPWREGARLIGFSLKAFINAAVGLTVALHIVDCKFAESATAPTLGSALGSVAATVISGTWETIVDAGFAETVLGPEDRAILIVSGALAGDYVCAPQFYLHPLTPVA